MIAWGTTANWLFVVIGLVFWGCMIAFFWRNRRRG
jgi:hypothetical protein